MQTMYPGMINSPRTDTVGAIGAAETTITVTNGAALPAAPNLAVLGSGDLCETILYTVKTDNILSGVTRGVQGAAQDWPAETPVARNFTEADYAAIKANIEKLFPTAETAGLALFWEATGIEVKTAANARSALGAAAQTDMSTVQTAIGTLQDEMAGGTSAIAALETDVGTAQTDISSLQGRMTGAEGDIDTLQTDMSAALGDISALETSVTGLNTSKANAVSIVTDLASTSKTINPAANNTEYRLGTLTSLVISAYAAGDCEFLVTFTAGAGCTVTLPAGTVWFSGSAPAEWSSGKVYEISVKNGRAVSGGF